MVQVRQNLDETRWMLELADQYPYILAVVGWVDLRSPEAITVGTGDVWVFTDGHVIQGQWHRPDANQPANFTADGTEIRLSPGNTWVALAKKDTAVWRD